MRRYLIITYTLFCFFSCTIKKTATDKEQSVEINGKNQFYLAKGNGDPAVVFVSGLGPTMDDFQELQIKVAKQTKTVCYDRAGIGKSEPFNTERNLENISLELNELIDKIGLDKPFILIGHSRGGVIARYFASKYPEKICGLILIDPAIPELLSLKRALRTDTEKVEFDKYYNSFCIDTQYIATIRNEFKSVYSTDSSDVSGKGFLLNIPITLIGSSQITTDKYSKEEIEIKTGLLKNYLKINPKIKLILTDKSGHYIYDTEPELVINEIVTMLNNIRTK